MASRRIGRIPAEDAAQQIAHLHAVRGGSTFSLQSGDLSGERLFAVSLFPERTRRVAGPTLSAALILRYIERNADLLRDPRVSVGTWFDEEQGVTFLDVSVTLPERTAAEALARRYNQIGIYDLHAGQWIPTGGTGEEVGHLPPEADRLPKESQ